MHAAETLCVIVPQESRYSCMIVRTNMFKGKFTCLRGNQCSFITQCHMMYQSWKKFWERILGTKAVCSTGCCHRLLPDLLLKKEKQFYPGLKVDECHDITPCLLQQLKFGLLQFANHDTAYTCARGMIPHLYTPITNLLKSNMIQRAVNIVQCSCSVQGTSNSRSGAKQN